MAEQAEIVRRRGREKAAFTRIVNFVDSISVDTEMDAVNVRLERIEEIFKQFSEYDLALPEELSEMEEFENNYFKVKSRMRTFLASKLGLNTETPTQITNVNSQLMNSSFKPANHFKMPRLNIPIFQGEYLEWPSFKDLYKGIVHDNASLSNVQKFQYLKGLLGDTPAAIIRHIPVSDASYDEAWSKLLQRYDKKKQIVSSLISTFLNQSKINYGSEHKLRSLADTSEQVIRGLKTLDSEASNRDVWLIHLLLEKLDSETCRVWNEKVVDTEFPTFQSLIDFLNDRCSALEMIECDQSKQTIIKQEIDQQPRLSNSKGIFCKGQHFVSKCLKFKNLNVTARKDFVRRKSLCFNCLSDKHQARQCTSQFSCRYCKAKHHSCLHENVRSNYATTVDAYREEPIQPVKLDTGQSGAIALNAIQGNTALLPTALASIHDSNGNIKDIRILLDSGSQATFISDSSLRKLGLKYSSRIRTPITGLAISQPISTIGSVQLRIFSKLNAQEKFDINAFVLSKLTPPQPSISVNFKDRELLIGLTLADPTFSTPSDIDLIIGADIFFSIILPGQVIGSSGLPIAQNSRLGWIVTGKIGTEPIASLGLVVNNLNLGDELKRFWELESIPNVAEHKLSEEEQFCENHFNENLLINSNGRYEVKLPFYRTDLKLGDSYNSAIVRLQSVEKKFERYSDLKQQYEHFMHEYQDLDHMRLADDDSNMIADENKFFLPHHAVFKQSSTTTKLRVVFDGSCATKGSVSLNAMLGVGAKLQRDICEILLSFRLHKIVFVSDITKMYRQIRVSPPDQTYQRILWRYDNTEPISEYKLQTITYGLACSFLAIRCLKQIGIDAEKEFPTAARVIKEDFYVDDLLSGTNTRQEAIQVCKQVLLLLQARGLELRKWRSNSQELLQELNVESDSLVMEIQGKEHCKVLGLNWDSNKDVFYFVPCLEIDLPLTKRKILSQSAQIFDPLGLLSPCTVWIKIFYQKLWILKCDWDDDLPEHLVKDWLKFQIGFNSINLLRIPRCVSYSNEAISLHGFCDSSSQAYAAVIYCRQECLEQIRINILISKTKVAPIKQISIPKLELCSALLLTQLFKSVLKTLNLSNIQIYAWTDSKVVLAWLSCHPRRWNTFVANRTAEILDTLPVNHWNHISSKENPADVASRGLEPGLLPQCDLWWHGPTFLCEQSSSWKKQDSDIDLSNLTIPEQRPDPIFANTTLVNNTLHDSFEKHSSLFKIIRILAYCHKFISKLKTKSLGIQATNANSIPLISSEIDYIKKLLFRWVQGIYFKEELECIKVKRPLRNNSKLISLNPFIDQDGVLRAGGRLKRSALPFNSKYPVILPYQHKISVLLIRESHIANLHAGPTLLSHILKQFYWIIGAKKLIRNVIHKCLVCFRFRSTTTSQLMGDLPKARVNVSRPFTNCGIDFAGPILLKMSKGRGSKSVKGYIALFVCLATKAIHLEAVSDLTADSFIAALKRFCSRRGAPTNIYCDNATNFLGARRKLNELELSISKINEDENIAYFLTQSTIHWHMIPPSSPHFGGIWEAGIKSTKFHLKRVIGESLLTFEELATLLCQIEGILNSRPLVASNDQDTDSIQVLTPSHFLTGDVLSSIPEQIDDNLPPLKRWQLVQNMKNSFWKRWQSEYLHSLQQRQKWRNPELNLEIGDLVLLKESQLPPANWPLGKVMEIHPGDDNRVRVVTIKTAKGHYKRSIQKLVKLPV